MTEIEQRRKNLALRTKPASSDLTPEEYFVWSQIKEGLTLRDLIPICPWTAQETLNRVESLIKKNSAEWGEPPKRLTEPSAQPQKNISPEIEKHLLDEDKDAELKKLSKTFRVDTLVKFSEPATANPYEIFEISPKASTNEIKKQYLNLSKKFHPDRFFRKKLGHYKPKLDAIFSRIQKAYQILKNPIEKEALDRTLALHASHAEPSPHKKSAKLDKEMEKFGKSESHFKRGLELEKEQDYIVAYNELVLACQIDPKRDAFKKATDRVKPLMLKQKAQKSFEAVKKAYHTLGPSEDMLYKLEEALHFDSNLSGAHFLFAKLILDLQKGDRYRDAKEMLLRAKGANPKDPEPSYYLAKAYLALGEEKLAKKELLEALERNANHSPSKKLLEKLK